MSVSKKRKANLPKNWIVVNSTSLPDRVYYFNVRTGKSSWEEPSLEADQPEPKVSSGQKRKFSVSDDEAEIPAVTGSGLGGSNAGEMSKRKMLSVKRTTEPAKATETPQMKALRKKMLDRKGKPASNEKKKASVSGTAPKNNKSNPSLAGDKLGKNGGHFQGRHPKSKAGGETSSIASSSNSGKLIGAASQSVSSVAGKRLDVSCAASENTRGSRAMRSRGKERLENSKSGVSKNVNLKKNLAKKRLDVLNKKLSVERKKIEPLISETLAVKKVVPKKTNEILGQGIVNVAKVRERPSTPTEPVPNFYEGDESRFMSLRARQVSRSSSSNAETWSEIAPAEKSVAPKIPRIPKINKTVEKTVDKKDVPDVVENIAAKARTPERNFQPENPFSDSFFEEMEWEPIEEEKVVVEIQEVRIHLSSDQGATDHKFLDYARNGLQLPRALPNADKQIVYVVVDTNVFLSNLKVVTELLDDSPKFEDRRPVVVVPWMVLQELDYIKDNKSKTKSGQLQWSAKTAVDFLFRNFASKHPRLQGQTAADAASNRIKYQVESPDDEILQSCLQIRESGCTVVLLSNDKNLCNKAMVHNVPTYRSHESIRETLKPIAAKVWGSDPVVQTRLEPAKISFSENRADKVDETETDISDDIFGEAKAIMKSFFSSIVSKEMEKFYGENWKKYTIVPPPWSITDVLKCASKHWIAVIGDVFMRQAEPLVKKLSEMFLNAQKYSQSLKNVREMLEVCHDLPQMIKSDEYKGLSEETRRGIKELINTCQLNSKRLEDDNIVAVIERENNLHDEQRANNAFDYFEQIWTFTNNFCGMAADLSGIPHSVTYRSFRLVPTPETIQQLQPDVVSKLHQLINALRTVLDEKGYLTPLHPALLKLYHNLVNYLPNTGEFNYSINLDIIDLLCCINVKKELLRTGLVQLQELREQFCRIAVFRSMTASVLN